MKLGKRSRGAVALAAVVVAAASGCSTKAPESSGGGGGGEAADVQTDIGVEGDDDHASASSPTSPACSPRSARTSPTRTSCSGRSNQVCDTYDVELDVQDTGYVPQQGVQLYSGMKDSVLAMQQTIGSPINTALAPEYEADQIVNFPSAWSKTLTEIPGTGVVGATYDVEIANGYDYLFQEGLLKEGDTVGHIYFEGEYGANGLAGSQAVAEEKGLELIEAQIKSTDQDMSAQVTQFKAAGVDMIALTVGPRAAGVGRPRWRRRRASTCRSWAATPSSLPACSRARRRTGSRPTCTSRPRCRPSTRNPDLLEAYEAAYPDATPSLGVVVGFGMSELMKQVLDAACENGDLTREGVVEAFEGLEEVDTGGLVVPIRGFETRQVAEPGELRPPAGRRAGWRRGRWPRRSRASSRRRSPADLHRLTDGAPSFGRGRRSAVRARYSPIPTPLPDRTPSHRPARPHATPPRAPPPRAAPPARPPRAPTSPLRSARPRAALPSRARRPLPRRCPRAPPLTPPLLSPLSPLPLPSPRGRPRPLPLPVPLLSRPSVRTSVLLTAVAVVSHYFLFPYFSPS